MNEDNEPKGCLLVILACLAFWVMVGALVVWAL